MRSLTLNVVLSEEMRVFVIPGVFFLGHEIIMSPLVFMYMKEAILYYNASVLFVKKR